MKSDLFVKSSQSCIQSICFGCYSNNVSESIVEVETEVGKHFASAQINHSVHEAVTIMQTVDLFTHSLCTT